ncbi:MAG: bacteriohemerythrin [Spirochaetia bacterium]|nr:bacteriohemerythrin [Spirochaetia bacterium]
MQIQWGSQYNLGIKMIDDQHQWLINLYNKIDSAKSRNQPVEILGTYMKGLLHYTRFHFNAEENELKRIDYKQFVEHKDSHERFIKKINESLQEFDQGNEEVVVYVLDYLKDWLLNHIMREDKKYVPLMKTATNSMFFQSAAAAQSFERTI